MDTTLTGSSSKPARRKPPSVAPGQSTSSKVDSARRRITAARQARERLAQSSALSARSRGSGSEAEGETRSLADARTGTGSLAERRIGSFGSLAEESMASSLLERRSGSGSVASVRDLDDAVFRGGGRATGG